MNKKILVTGGAGYIGSVLVPELLKANYSVSVLDNFMYKQDSLLNICYHPHLEIIKGDVRNEDLIKKVVKDHDIIIPLAALVGAPACENNSVYAQDVNYESIMTMLKYVSKDQKILFPVTNSGYGIGQPGVYCDETTPLNPISIYGRTKVEAEKLILQSGNGITFRLATVFGASARMRLDLLVNDFVSKAYFDKSIVLFEPHFKRNYVHIRDVARVFLFGIESYHKMNGEAYNVGLSSANFSKIELCQKIKEQINDFYIVESPYGKDPDKRNYIVSNDKIERMGFEPQYGIEFGIRELIKAYTFLNTNSYKNV